MIHTVADLLAKLIEEEDRRLRDYRLTHGPTIGEMYEGLTRDVLNQVIPRNLNMDVVSGFVTDDTGALSPQIDCMIVCGEGEQIPHTNRFKWHVKDVVAVFEVKKTLYSVDLIDAYEKLRAVMDNLSRHLADGSARAQTFKISSALQAFEQMTGWAAPEHKNASSLPLELKMIYHSLVIERFSPIRIALGYDGFSSEWALREAFFKFLGDNKGQRGFGVRSIPQLCISGQFSLVKMNGQPYVTRLQDGWWPLVASSRTNPVRLLLEFIWTRLSRQFGVDLPWGNDLEMEGLNNFLRAKAVHLDERKGWHYTYVFISKQDLEGLPKETEWLPEIVDEVQYIVFNNLCNGGEVRTTDGAFQSFVKEHGQDPRALVDTLLSTGLVARHGDMLKLTTEELACVALSDGRLVVGENNTGRLSRWVQGQIRPAST